MIGTLITLDRGGDSKLIWDREKPVEVDNARRMFKDLMAKGYWAYAVRTNGEKGIHVTEFDPEAEKIILAPRVVGG